MGLLVQSKFRLPYVRKCEVNLGALHQGPCLWPNRCSLAATDHLTQLEAYFIEAELAIFLLCAQLKMFKCLAAQCFLGARSCAGLSFSDNKESGKVG